MSIHPEPHPLAGQTVAIRAGVEDPRNMVIGGAKYRIEDWWDRIAGGSWTTANGNPAAMQYAIRSGFSREQIPTDDEVLYGKIDGYGHLVHVTEIDGAS